MLTKERKSRLFSYAMSYFSEEKFGMSIDLLDEILSSDPDNKIALLTRGSIYLKMCNSKKALWNFNRAIKIDFENLLIKVDGPDGVIGDCARAVAEILE